MGARGLIQRAECGGARKTLPAAAVGGLLLCLPGFSQLNSGSISGGVTDQSGAVIAGAKVTVIDAERGVSRSLVVVTEGQYTAPSLTPGMNTAPTQS